jgi:hypothetical protein
MNDEGRHLMNRSRFLVIASILGLVFGLAFLLVPAQLMSLYGVTLDRPANGSRGFSALSWWGSRSSRGWHGTHQRAAS